MTDVLAASSYLLLLYYTATNVVYLFLLVASIRATVAHHRRLTVQRLQGLRTSALAPPISVLVPARNEEKGIVDSVRSMLALDYPEIEVIVVNDGSTDGTLEALRRHFGLVRTNILHVSEIPTAPVRGIFMSTVDRRLIVIDKESCGRKADALNAGLNAASSPFFCAVDADAVLESDALLRVMAPALADPVRVIASGGIVRVANGSTIEHGMVRRVGLPRTLIETLQVIEYLRAFLIGRQGWAEFNLLVIISGAFGVFRRDLCREIGGFRTGAIGEDMDLVVRLHRHARTCGDTYRIAFVPDPVCWTEAPSTYRSLARQRARWQNGLADVLWRNRDMVGNPRYGAIGFVALPYQWLFEFLAPVIEVSGWMSMIAAAAVGALGPAFFVQFLLFGYLFGTMISIGSVVIEEMTYHRYNDPRDLLRLLGACFLEHFPYRQLNCLWRLRGTWEFLIGKTSWQMIDRVGLGSKASVTGLGGAGIAPSHGGPRARRSPQTD
jgi:cellulose synthase/poly-beta-1,6-N-acetylglucosamine synthase-like glycosyltransferase